MILADKIMTLRKKNGWSQEELAEKMNVSRQSVSKWEGAQSVPDLDKILLLGQIFGVSTDYLLKDDMEEAEYVESFIEEDSPVRRVSLEEASQFIKVKEETTKKIAFATILCIFSPICLLLLGAASEVPAYGISEEFAGGIGMVVLFIIVAIAVAIFIACEMKTSPYEYMEKEIIDTEYGVSGMVKERQQQFHDTYIRKNIIGTCFCIFSLVPLIMGMAFLQEDFQIVITLCIMLVLVAIGVWFFITAGIPWETMQKLLQEGDYTVEKKRNPGKSGAISAIYWLAVTAIFFLFVYCFEGGEWKNCWVIWAVAGVLYPAVLIGYNTFKKKD